MSALQECRVPASQAWNTTIQMSRCTPLSVRVFVRFYKNVQALLALSFQNHCDWIYFRVFIAPDWSGAEWWQDHSCAPGHVAACPAGTTRTARYNDVRGSVEATALQTG